MCSESPAVLTFSLPASASVAATRSVMLMPSSRNICSPELRSMSGGSAVLFGARSGQGYRMASES